VTALPKMEGFDSKNNFKNMDFESADINPYADNSLNVKSWRRLFDSMEDGEDKLMISKDFFISDHEDKLLDEFDAIVASKNDSKSHGQNIEKNSVESLISQNERYRVQVKLSILLRKLGVTKYSSNRLTTLIKNYGTRTRRLKRWNKIFLF
jgi:hypothetical protein